MYDDKIIHLDRFQTTDKGITCKVDPRHGKLGVHNSGAFLICTLCEPQKAVKVSTSGLLEKE